jgi:hypothetical protein
MRRKTVLKKAGIVAAVATAGVLALTPLAFANDHHDGDRDRGTTRVMIEEGDVQRDQINACSFSQDIDNDSILPLGQTSTQSQDDNCVNVGDGSEYTTPGAGEGEDGEAGEDTAGLLGAIGDLLGGLL